MKKIVLSLVLVATVAFVSCKDTAKETPAVEETTIEEAAPVAEEVTEEAAVVEEAPVAEEVTEEAVVETPAN